MKLDPKYFNLFITVCAVFTVVVILYGTIRYHRNQEKTFRENIEAADLNETVLSLAAETGSVRLSAFKGNVVIVNFWATWSEKSKDVHHFLHELEQRDQELVVIAAAVRDDDDMVREYIRNERNNFIYVDGTSFYHDLQVPGVPSQILIDRTGRFADLQIGEDQGSLTKKIEALLNHEQL
ncbi:MAG: TlpA disulfide reductase family protein [Balneolaceae bacterium]